ncbi:hypothetical protein HYH03_008528 [Edaphochlamys debaryana]|uniref:BTB domain-containing protein n=1 Tax=Edaphochlamys debaryana TaxID=47281 RepID=A0A835Y3E4_9CHLO|nr:hypothetical protein HYH03_008528 [Edaphochlamys debaryana]|eukprot:KAG2493401.1 hypothetical protein HYH03_008528 [Edaphochlamys debaryana]
MAPTARQVSLGQDGTHNVEDLVVRPRPGGGPDQVLVFTSKADGGVLEEEHHYLHEGGVHELLGAGGDGGGDPKPGPQLAPVGWLWMSSMHATYDPATRAVFFLSSAATAICMLDTSNTVRAVAGSAEAAGSADGVGRAARFNRITSLAADGRGGVWVADCDRIRRLDTRSGEVTTVAGARSRYVGWSKLAFHPGTGTLWAATRDTLCRVRTEGGGGGAQLEVVAGDWGARGHTDGSGTAESFGDIGALLPVSGGRLLIADGADLRCMHAGGAVTTLLRGCFNASGVMQMVLLPDGVLATITHDHTMEPISSGDWEPLAQPPMPPAASGPAEGAGGSAGGSTEAASMITTDGRPFLPPAASAQGQALQRQEKAATIGVGPAAGSSGAEAPQVSRAEAAAQGAGSSASGVASVATPVPRPSTVSMDRPLRLPAPSVAETGAGGSTGGDASVASGVVTVRVGDRAFRAHRSVLSASSEYFAKLLAPGGGFEESGAAEVSLPDADPAAFSILLSYMLTCTSLGTSRAAPLLRAVPTELLRPTAALAGRLRLSGPEAAQLAASVQAAPSSAPALTSRVLSLGRGRTQNAELLVMRPRAGGRPDQVLVFTREGGIQELEAVPSRRGDFKLGRKLASCEGTTSKEVRPTYDPVTSAVYFASSSTCISKLVSQDAVSPVAGSAQAAGSADGVGRAARFSRITSLSADGRGGVWVADTYRIRRLDTRSGEVTTLAGEMQAWSALAFDPTAGTLWAATLTAVCRVYTEGGGRVQLVAGDWAQAGAVDGREPRARFKEITALLPVSRGRLLIADGPHLRCMDAGGAVTTLLRGCLPQSEAGVQREALLPNGDLVTWQSKGRDAVRQWVPLPGGGLAAADGDGSLLLISRGEPTPPTQQRGTAATARPPNLPAAAEGAGGGASATSTDVTVRVGDRAFPAHRSVLAAGSEYFAWVLAPDGGLMENGPVEVALPDADPAAFQPLLLYMYNETFHGQPAAASQLLQNVASCAELSPDPPELLRPTAALAGRLLMGGAVAALTERLAAAATPASVLSDLAWADDHGLTDLVERLWRGGALATLQKERAAAATPATVLADLAWAKANGLPELAERLRKGSAMAALQRVAAATPATVLADLAWAKANGFSELAERLQKGDAMAALVEQRAAAARPATVLADLAWAKANGLPELAERLRKGGAMAALQRVAAATPATVLADLAWAKANGFSELAERLQKGDAMAALVEQRAAAARPATVLADLAWAKANGLPELAERLRKGGAMAALQRVAAATPATVLADLAWAKANGFSELAERLQKGDAMAALVEQRAAAARPATVLADLAWAKANGLPELAERLRKGGAMAALLEQRAAAATPATVLRDLAWAKANGFSELAERLRKGGAMAAALEQRAATAKPASVLSDLAYADSHGMTELAERLRAAARKRKALESSSLEELGQQRPQLQAAPALLHQTPVEAVAPTAAPTVAPAAAPPAAPVVAPTAAAAEAPAPSAAVVVAEAPSPAPAPAPAVAPITAAAAVAPAPVAPAVVAPSLAPAPAPAVAPITAAADEARGAATAETMDADPAVGPLVLQAPPLERGGLEWLPPRPAKVALTADGRGPGGSSPPAPLPAAAPPAPGAPSAATALAAVGPAGPEYLRALAAESGVDVQLMAQAVGWTPDMDAETVLASWERFLLARLESEGQG